MAKAACEPGLLLHRFPSGINPSLFLLATRVISSSKNERNSTNFFIYLKTHDVSLKKHLSPEPDKWFRQVEK